jgi:hypothetical protein
VTDGIMEDVYDVPRESYSGLATVRWRL